MNQRKPVTHAIAVLAAVSLQASAYAATTVQMGSSGKTYASSVVACVVNPATGAAAPTVKAGLFNPAARTEAVLRLNGAEIKQLDASLPDSDVWLVDGTNTVTVMLDKRATDTHVFTVASGLCSPPPGNFYSPDGTLEYAPSGKSYMTVQPGCAYNPAKGLTQPFVNLFDNGNFLLNVSVNGVPLTQLSARRPRAVVFLGAGRNVITAANGGLSTDTYYRDGGTGTCTLP